MAEVSGQPLVEEVNAQQQLEACKSLMKVVEGAIATFSQAGSGLQMPMSNSKHDISDQLTTTIVNEFLSAFSSFGQALVGVAATLSGDVVKPLQQMRSEADAKFDLRRLEVKKLQDTLALSEKALADGLRRDKQNEESLKAAQDELKATGSSSKSWGLYGLASASSSSPHARIDKAEKLKVALQSEIKLRTEEISTGKERLTAANAQLKAAYVYVDYKRMHLFRKLLKLCALSCDELATSLFASSGRLRRSVPVLEDTLSKLNPNWESDQVPDSKELTSRRNSSASSSSAASPEKAPSPPHGADDKTISSTGNAVDNSSSPSGSTFLKEGDADVQEERQRLAKEWAALEEEKRKLQSQQARRRSFTSLAEPLDSLDSSPTDQRLKASMESLEASKEAWQAAHEALATKEQARALAAQVLELDRKKLDEERKQFEEERARLQQVDVSNGSASSAALAAERCRLEAERASLEASKLAWKEAKEATTLDSSSSSADDMVAERARIAEDRAALEAGQRAHKAATDALESRERETQLASEKLAAETQKLELERATLQAMQQAAAGENSALSVEESDKFKEAMASLAASQKTWEDAKKLQEVKEQDLNTRAAAIEVLEEEKQRIAAERKQFDEEKANLRESQEAFVEAREAQEASEAQTLAAERKKIEEERANLKKSQQAFVEAKEAQEVAENVSRASVEQSLEAERKQLAEEKEKLEQGLQALKDAQEAQAAKDLEATNSAAEALELDRKKLADERADLESSQQAWKQAQDAHEIKDRERTFAGQELEEERQQLEQERAAFAEDKEAQEAENAKIAAERNKAAVALEAERIKIEEERTYLQSRQQAFAEAHESQEFSAAKSIEADRLKLAEARVSFKAELQSLETAKEAWTDEQNAQAAREKSERSAVAEALEVERKQIAQERIDLQASQEAFVQAQEARETRDQQERQLEAEAVEKERQKLEEERVKLVARERAWSEAQNVSEARDVSERSSMEVEMRKLAEERASLDASLQAWKEAQEAQDSNEAMDVAQRNSAAAALALERKELEEQRAKLQANQQAWKEVQEARDLALLEREESLRTLQEQLTVQQADLLETRRQSAMQTACQLAVLEQHQQVSTEGGNRSTAQFVIMGENSQDDGWFDGQQRSVSSGHSRTGSCSADADGVWDIDWNALPSRPTRRPSKGSMELLSGSADDMCEIDADTRGQAPPDPEWKFNDFSWLRRSNGEQHRAARREVSALTQRAITSRGYRLGQSETVHLSHVDAMLSGTKLISPCNGSWPSPTDSAPSRRPKRTKVRIARSVVFEEAAKLTAQGKAVVAVNAASAYHLGGGFKTGGRHALEEAMCVQSTLYASLLRAADVAHNVQLIAPEWARPAQKACGSDWTIHIPEDGVVLSPAVEVFRQGTNDGYRFQDSPVRLQGVISVAMPNCNDRVSDSPVDAHPEPSGYEAQLRHKWNAVLTGAARYAEADTIVVPDAGCGVFRNQADKSGRVLGELLRDDFAYSFEELVIAFPGGENGEIFAEHVLSAFGPEQLEEDEAVDDTAAAAAPASEAPAYSPPEPTADPDDEILALRKKMEEKRLLADMYSGEDHTAPPRGLAEKQSMPGAHPDMAEKLQARRKKLEEDAPDLT